MSALDELKAAVEVIAADATKANDQVNATLDHVVKIVDHDPELVALVDSLRHSHTTFTDSVKALKDKVDSVTASAGPAA